MTDADYVLVESTYGGREHEPEGEAIRILAETVRMVADANGVLLVPSFAVGRTQEVVWELDRLIERGEIPLLPLYLDSPMASKASDIYRRHPDYYDEETARLLREGESPLDYPNQIVTNDVKASQAIARAPRPYMIVASNGMLTGGRVVGHLRNLIDDPTATILFVGYQGEGTLGSHLQAGAKAGPLPDALDQRVLRPCGRERAARLARPFRRGQAAGRSGLSAPGLPRPRRPRGPGRAGTEGPRARPCHARPALARARHARLTGS
jgi:predicted metal-dependent RNase